MSDVARVEEIIDRLKNIKSFPEWYPIIGKYGDLVESGLSLEAGLRAIQGATELPPSDNPTQDSAGSLVGYLADSRFPRDHGVAAIPTILELYPALPEKARMYAIWLLMNIPEREGAEAVMTLVRQYFVENGIPESAFNTRYHHPAHAEIYFPELLNYARLSVPSHPFRIWLMCLQYCNKGVLKPHQIAAHSNIVTAEYRTLKSKLLPVQTYTDWRKEYEYIADRETAGLLLDLMRFFSTDDVRQELTAALREFRDPVLLCWASIAALWLGMSVNAAIVERIAASDESRNRFFENLKEHNQVHLFPEQYRTKAAFAQSELVGWLTFPTELGYVPEAIELTHTITEANDRGIDEWFLFRYRDEDWESGAWLAGWSGPYPTDTPAGDILTPGGTFSSFQRWDSQLPVDHLGLDNNDDPPMNITVTTIIDA